MLVVVVPAMALAGVSVVAFFVQWFWLADVAANFRPQYLVALVVLGAVLMMGKWRTTGAIALAAAALNLVVVLPLFVGSPGEAPASAPTIRVMTFNLLGSANESYGEVIDLIREQDPDLVLLHEAHRPWELAVDPLGSTYRILRPRSDDLIFGTLVLVKGQLLDWESFGFAAADPRAIELTFVPESWDTPVEALAVHPLAPTDSARAALRDSQMEFAAEWASEREGAFLVAGDLNATPWSWVFRNLEHSSDLSNTGVGFGIQATYPATGNPLTRIPIDHVLASSAFAVRSRILGPATGSDHLPVIVDLALRS